MDTYKIKLKLVRSIALGFSIHSPKLNGFCVSIYVFCFTITLWSRGNKMIGFCSYWNG